MLRKTGDRRVQQVGTNWTHTRVTARREGKIDVPLALLRPGSDICKTTAAGARKDPFPGFPVLRSGVYLVCCGIRKETARAHTLVVRLPGRLRTYVPRHSARNLIDDC